MVVFIPSKKSGAWIAPRPRGKKLMVRDDDYLTAAEKLASPSSASTAKEDITRLSFISILLEL